MKISKIVLCLIFSISLLTSCDKEEVIDRKIEGDWDVTLYAENGLDLLGSDIIEVEIEFQTYDNSLGKGDFIWITEVPNERQVVTGEYFLNEDETQLNFDNTDQENFFFEFDIELSETDLELRTNLGGGDYLIQAEKR